MSDSQSLSTNIQVMSLKLTKAPVRQTNHSQNLLGLHTTLHYTTQFLELIGFAPSLTMQIKNHRVDTELLPEQISQKLTCLLGTTHHNHTTLHCTVLSRQRDAPILVVMQLLNFTRNRTIHRPVSTAQALYCKVGRGSHSSLAHLPTFTYVFCTVVQLFSASSSCQQLIYMQYFHCLHVFNKTCKTIQQ